MFAAEMLVEEIQRKGIELNLIVFNTLIDRYCKKGMIDEALELREVIGKKGFELDLFTCKYNSLWIV